MQETSNSGGDFFGSQRLPFPDVFYMLVTGHRSLVMLVTGHLSLVTGHSSLIIGLSSHKTPVKTTSTPRKVEPVPDAAGKRTFYLKWLDTTRAYVLWVQYGPKTRGRDAPSSF